MQRFQQQIPLKVVVPLLILATAIFGTIYMVVQQVYRQDANDPQVEMAEDGAAQLNAGADPSAINTTGRIDMGQSLSPFYIVFDKNGKVVAANGALNGQVPTPPSGVFNSAKGGKPTDLGSLKKFVSGKEDGTNNEDRFTWQPASGVRIAAVLTPYNNGFVLAGRSLREVEKKENSLLKIIALSYLVTIAFVIASLAFLEEVVPQKTKKSGRKS